MPTIQPDEFSSVATALFAVHQTLDAIGVERGPLEIRLAYLRGVGLGLQRWPLQAVAAPVAAPAAVAAPVAAAAAPATTVQEAADLDEIRRIATATSAEVASIRPLPAETTEDPIDWSATEDLPIEQGTWTDSERRAFFASLKDSGINDPYAVVAAYCESKLNPRPSRMPPEQRNGFLAALGKNTKGAKDRYLEWAAIHGEGAIAEAKAAEKAKRAAAKAVKAAS